MLASPGQKKQSYPLSSNPIHREKEYHSLLRSLTKLYFKTVNLTARLYLLKARKNHSTVTVKQVFCAEISDIVNKWLSLPSTNYCRTMPLQGFPQQGSRSPPLSSPAAVLGRNWAPGHCLHDHHSQPCTNCLSNSREKKKTKPNPLPSPPPQKNPLLCHCLYFICKMKEAVTSYQCKKSEGWQEDHQCNRYYCRLLNSHHWLPTIKQNYPGRKAENNGNN